ncbi:MAG: glycine--tRNA ligase [Planctomycetota bacterium]
MEQPEDLMDRIVSLCKRKGFIFQSSEIYGGIGSCYDYGPLGVELLRNVKEAWWRAIVTSRRDIVGLDSAIIQSPRVWEASGHVQNFSDPLVDCRECKARFRADRLEEARCPEEKYGNRPATACQAAGLFTEPRQFNLMFQTQLGPVEGSGSIAYLRPETAQGIFTNFLNVVNASRMKPPFGIAQIGKSFRNEITPGNFVFRTREFEQMEMEYFVPPDEEESWYEYWVAARLRWYEELGVNPDCLRIRQHDADELAHYSTGCTDVEYRFPFGWDELEGIAKRGSYDLSRHSEFSGTRLQFYDEESKTHYLPHVVEPAAGVTRIAMVFLIDAYEEEQIGVDKKGKPDLRTVLHFHPVIAPITVAVFPLVKRDGMPERADRIEAMLRLGGLRTFYDEKGAIGRRYRRQDEIGTPWCVTIDGQTFEDGTVTVRERDSMKQERVHENELCARLQDRLSHWAPSEETRGDDS